LYVDKLTFALLPDPRVPFRHPRPTKGADDRGETSATVGAFVYGSLLHACKTQTCDNNMAQTMRV